VPWPRNRSAIALQHQNVSSLIGADSVKGWRRIKHHQRASGRAIGKLSGRIIESSSSSNMGFECQSIFVYLVNGPGTSSFCQQPFANPKIQPRRAAVIESDAFELRVMPASINNPIRLLGMQKEGADHWPAV